MGRRLARLTLDNLDDLNEPCAECVFWELDPVRRGRVAGHERDEKSAWLSEVLREWGTCGWVIHVDDLPVGHLIYAPPVFVPGARSFPTAPVGTDSVLLVTGHVAPAYRGQGLGRVLVQVMAKDLIRHGGIRAVEAFGDTRGRAGHCVLPADFLLGVGFKTQRHHPRHPRMRMDLRSVISWREDFETALDRMLGAVGGRRPATEGDLRREGRRRPLRHGAH